MINEIHDVLVGIDQGRVTSMVCFYTRKHSHPITVSLTPGETHAQIPTPKDIFPLVEQGAELGIAMLSSYFRQCFELIGDMGDYRNVRVMVTMDRIRQGWPQAITEAMEMLGVARERVHLQEHLESFYYYMMNQKKELWNYQVALLEYHNHRLTGYEMSIDRSTRPAFVYVEKRFRLYFDEKARAGRAEAEWNKLRDRLLLEKVQEMFRDKTFSSVYLQGEEFEKSWADKTIAFLCKRRHAFQGDNLFVKGACYGAMEQGGITSAGNFLFKGPQMVEHNVGMHMMVRGIVSYQPMISAGVSSYAAFYQCEFLLNGTDEVVLETRDLKGVEATHTITLTNLPKRPNRATRIHMCLTFPSSNQCKVQMDDMGLGELYPPTGKRWEATIQL